MNRTAIASELVKLAKELIAGTYLRQLKKTKDAPSYRGAIPTEKYEGEIDGIKVFVQRNRIRSEERGRVINDITVSVGKLSRGLHSNATMDDAEKVIGMMLEEMTTKQSKGTAEMVKPTDVDWWRNEADVSKSIGDADLKSILDKVFTALQGKSKDELEKVLRRYRQDVFNDDEKVEAEATVGITMTKMMLGF